MLGILHQLYIPGLDHYRTSLSQALLDSDELDSVFPRHRWMAILGSVISNGIPLESVTRPLQLLCTTPLFGDAQWCATISGVVHAVSERSLADREILWWILRTMQSELRLRPGVSYEVVIFLLTPIGPAIDSEAIKDLTPVALSNQWTQDAASLPASAHARVTDILRRLRLPAPESSRKRKIPSTEKVDELRDILANVLPAESLAGRTLQELLNNIQKPWSK